MSFSNVGTAWKIEDFKSYLSTLQKPSFVKSIVLHHTGAPSLAMRPNGLTTQHIRNIQFGYVNTNKWSAGPHFFIDEKEIFGMTPVSVRGIHAVSFNSSSLGIEVLGEYDSENPLSGRGLACWQLAAEATKALCEWLGLRIDSNTILFHRDDPKTKKTCPGRRVTKEWFLGLMNQTETITPVKEQTDIVSSTKDIARVVEYMSLNKGYTINEASSLLSRRVDGTYFGNIKLNTAVYMRSLNATVAEINELRKLSNK
jgi:N-acetylmuramoyl-L-alanine amidase CwlA